MVCPGFRPVLAAAYFFLALTLQAETGREAWLRYSRTTATVPAVLATINTSPILDNARDEILRGIRGMTGKTLRLESGMPHERRTNYPPYSASV